MNKYKIKKIQIARFCIQLLGIILTILTFFINYPMAMTILIGATFFMGPIFCGWVCPYGFLQDLLSKLGKILRIKKRRMPKAIQHILVFSRYIIFAFILLVSWDVLFKILNYDPKNNFIILLTGNSITLLSVIILVGFLVTSLIFDRPFCNYLCIEGAKYGLFSLFRPLTIERNVNSCISCGKCDSICPMNIEISKYKQVRSAQCINCFECVENCPVTNTLTFRITPITKGSMKKLLPLMITSIAFFFLYLTYTVNDSINKDIITYSQYNSNNSTTQTIEVNNSITGTIEPQNNTQEAQNNSTNDNQANIVTDSQDNLNDSSYNAISSTDTNTFESSQINTAEDTSNTSDNEYQNNSTDDNQDIIVTDTQDNLDDSSYNDIDSTDINSSESSQINTAEDTSNTSDNEDQNNSTDDTQDITVTDNQDNSNDNSADNIEGDINIDSSTDTIINGTSDESEVTTNSDTQVIQGDTAQAFGDAAGIDDGVYQGKGKGYKGNITVQVTVKNQLITEVAVTKTYDDARWFNRAYNTIVAKIIDTQTASVDTVSGATFSSNGIIDAVKDALSNAR